MPPQEEGDGYQMSAAQTLTAFNDGRLPQIRYGHITWPFGSHGRKRRHHRLSRLLPQRVVLLSPQPLPLLSISQHYSKGLIHKVSQAQRCEGPAFPPHPRHSIMGIFSLSLFTLWVACLYLWDTSHTHLL
ncbi:hypothetical protein JZ751_012377 [Albula glossodonta]|uniref:Uncharacterized protein n=1 Tax=Albula glossodonta TaxID=121402 RepID=A0A8T2PSA4_9TELE|nr:hypothetical protein JZ751_012377 [Albula glossodonta]